MADKKTVPLGIRFNANKAGLDRTVIAKEKIQETVVEASKGSKFFINEQRKEAALAPKIAALVSKAALLRSDAESLSTNQTRIDLDTVPQLEAEWGNFDRTIVHVDMDSFYCAAELRERPDLRGKPMAVGGISMLSTSSYEARRFGVRSGMPGFIAKKLCPQLIMVPTNFPLYTAISKQVRGVLAQFDPNFMMASLDEGYLDVTSYCKATDETPAEVATEIRRRVHQVTQLTCSAGVACNTLLAKIASDMNKPNGQTVLEHQCRRDSMEFLSELSVRKIPGIGKRMESTLDALGVKNCGQVYDERALLCALISPISYKFILRTAGLGLGSSKVTGDGNGNSSQKRLGMSRERTFPPVSTKPQIKEICEELCSQLAKDVADKGLAGRCVFVKVKMSNFKLRTRSITLDKPLTSVEILKVECWKLLEMLFPMEIRLLGVRMAQLETEVEGGRKPDTLCQTTLVTAPDSNTDKPPVISVVSTELASTEQNEGRSIGDTGSAVAHRSGFLSVPRNPANVEQSQQSPKMKSSESVLHRARTSPVRTNPANTEQDSNPLGLGSRKAAICQTSLPVGPGCPATERNQQGPLLEDVRAADHPCEFPRPRMTEKDTGRGNFETKKSGLCPLPSSPPIIEQGQQRPQLHSTATSDHRVISSPSPTSATMTVQEPRKAKLDEATQNSQQGLLRPSPGGPKTTEQDHLRPMRGNSLDAARCVSVCSAPMGSANAKQDHQLSTSSNLKKANRHSGPYSGQSELRTCEGYIDQERTSPVPTRPANTKQDNLLHEDPVDQPEHREISHSIQVHISQEEDVTELATFETEAGRDGTLESLCARVQHASQEEDVIEIDCAEQYLCPVCDWFRGNARQLDTHIDTCCSEQSGKIPGHDLHRKRKQSPLMEHFFRRAP